MTDHFERAQQRILKEAKNNGGVTTDHLLDALIATNEDLDDKLEAQHQEFVNKHEETRLWHESIKELVEEHIKESSELERRIAKETIERDRRITNLEIEFEDRRHECVPMVQKIAKEMHDQAHADYVASLGDSQFQGKLIWFFASTFGKIVLVIVGILAGIMLNFLFYGRP